MNTARSRYEIGNETEGVIGYALTFDAAARVAHVLLKKTNVPAYIFDRMAHKEKPNLYEASLCPGEAHQNPYIDHCAVCLPNWGIVFKATRK